MTAPDRDLFECAFRFMEELGAAGVDHPGGTLLAHLKRVCALLQVWGAGPALQLAGMCHASYGTDGFGSALLTVDRRPELVDVIGAEAESLVYLYASCSRRSTYQQVANADGVFHDRFTGAQFVPAWERRRDFAQLTAANELDIMRVSAPFRSQYGKGVLELLVRLSPLLSDAARGETESLAMLLADESR